MSGKNVGSKKMCTAYLQPEVRGHGSVRSKNDLTQGNEPSLRMDTGIPVYGSGLKPVQVTHGSSMHPRVPKPVGHTRRTSSINNVLLSIQYGKMLTEGTTTLSQQPMPHGS
jgi:hypothetical protein